MLELLDGSNNKYILPVNVSIGSEWAEINGRFTRP